MPSAISDMRDALVDLADRIDLRSDERSVLSLIAQRASDGSWQLECGSVLFGPRQMTTRSWPEWREIERPDERHADPAVYGVAVRSWRSFDHVAGNHRYVRFAMGSSVALNWLAYGLVHGLLRMRNGEPVHVSLGLPTSLITVFQQVDSPVSRLVAMAQRPCLGWFHGAVPDADATIPAEWEPGHPGRKFNASLMLLGIAPSAERDLELRRGLFVGRCRRRAWISDLRGAQPDFSTFDVGISLDPRRVSLWELALDLEELTEDGDLLSARRLRLADVALPPHGPGQVTVRLPTVRRRAVRRLRLYDSDARLQDAPDKVRLAESIQLRITAAGAAAHESTIGDNSSPTLQDRLDALDKIEREYAVLLADGLPGRIVGSGDDGRQLLRGRLAAARGELLIFDPYIGGDPRDWDVLADVSVPVRVLTGKSTPLPANVASKSPPVVVRRWIHGSRRTPFHDRAYLWNSGGLTVGTSPNGLGGRLALIDALEPAVVEGLTSLFNAWWSSSDTCPL